MPLVVAIEQTILQNGHLIDENKMPKTFLDLMAHVASYRALIKNWNEIIDRDKASNVDTINKQHRTADGIEPVIPHTGVINFPEELIDQVSAVFKKLKTKQTELIESSRDLVP